MASGRAAFGIGEFVTGVSHLEWRVGDAEGCAEALEPLGLSVVGRREQSPDGSRSVALAAGEVRIVLTERADEGARTADGWPEPAVIDLALQVSNVSAAQQVAVARGALPAGRARRAGRAVSGPAVRGPGELVHSLVDAEGWLGQFTPRTDAARRSALEGIPRIRLAVPAQRAGQWQRYYADILGVDDDPASRGATGAARVGATLLEIAGVPGEAPDWPIESVELAGGGQGALRSAVDDAGLAYRQAHDGDAVELIDASALLGVRLRVR